jgi:hypothetical protein
MISKDLEYYKKHYMIEKFYSLIYFNTVNHQIQWFCLSYFVLNACNSKKFKKYIQVLINRQFCLRKKPKIY